MDLNSYMCVCVCVSKWLSVNMHNIIIINTIYEIINLIQFIISIIYYNHIALTFLISTQIAL